jgi:hypothetical protein
VKWSVDGEVKMEVISERLKDNTVNFKPYVEMSNTNDAIEVLY